MWRKEGSKEQSRPCNTKPLYMVSVRCLTIFGNNRELSKTAWQSWEKEAGRSVGHHSNMRRMVQEQLQVMIQHGLHHLLQLQQVVKQLKAPCPVTNLRQLQQLCRFQPLLLSMHPQFHEVKIQFNLFHHLQFSHPADGCRVKPRHIPFNSTRSVICGTAIQFDCHSRVSTKQE